MPQYYHIRVRRDTAARWASNNPTPVAGELCIESNTNKMKIGDGVTAYNTLPYFTPPNATTIAAGLMSAADKMKLNGINLADYAPLNSPELTGTPKAVTNGYMPEKTIATDQAVLDRMAEAAIPFLAVRVVYSVGSAGEYAVCEDDAVNNCQFMAVNGKGVKIEKRQKLVAGDNTIDYIFEKGGVQQIPDNAFANIGNIKTVIFPERLMAAGSRAFISTNITELIAFGATPATLGANCFDDTPISNGTGRIFVHKVFISAYADVWSAYAGIISNL